ncbi:MAG: Ig-like domain-containing protein [Limisphaerales bacterium]
MQNGAQVKAGKTIDVKGIAFDGGKGIRQVEVSINDGKWTPAKLGKDLGKYSFREWHAKWTPAKPGNYTLKVCATNNAGQMQTEKPLWNPSGYMHNTIETTQVTVV